MRADDVEFGEQCPIDLRERVARAGESFHCDRCDRPVHVLSHMSEADAAAVLARRQREHLCVAFLRAPDGSVHFRGEDEVLVPTARLRRIVRASALALSVAACSSDEGDRTGPVAHEALEQPPTESESPDVIAPPQLNQQGQLEAEHDTEDFELHSGPPPRLDEPKAKGDRQVPFKSLRPIRTPDPHPDELLMASAGREKSTVQVSIRFCVDEKGRVVDAEPGFGDEKIAKMFIRTLTRWRFKPYEVDGRKTRVCTNHRFRVDLDRNEPT